LLFLLLSFFLFCCVQCLTLLDAIPISQFFSSVLMGGATESEFSSTEVAHELVYEIYKVAPGVLISVIPILEQALKATLFF